MMKIFVGETSEAMGAAAAKLIAEKINEAIKEHGEARIVLSTGSSQFETLSALIKEDIDWTRVTAFHLDEYVNLSIEHPASFRKYLKERFQNLVPLKEFVCVETEKDLKEEISYLTSRLREKPIDVGVIGIGENAHIAFNDPPADFDSREAYLVVDLAPRCKQQQVGEGWFATPEDVPSQAVSMSPYQIMQCKCIVSAVPHNVKANAIFNLLAATQTSNMVPATLLKEHSDFNLFIDADSASMCTKDML